MLEACQAGLDRLHIIYLRETKAIKGVPTVIDAKELEYLAKMVIRVNLGRKLLMAN